jgi:integrase
VTYAKKIKRLNRSTNLDDCVETERFILSLDRSSKYKQSLLLSYRHYCLANKIDWKPPRIKVQSAPILVPTEERIDKIINRGSLKLVVVFQITKHGLRPCEVSRITLRDIDFQRGLLTVRTSKLGAARTIKLKENVLLNLKAHIQRKNIVDLNLRLFPSPDRMRDQWNRYRKRAFLNLNS